MTEDKNEKDQKKTEEKQKVHIQKPESKEIKETSAKGENYFDQLIRLKADFENYQKRVEKEKTGLIEWGRNQAYFKFLSLYDTVIHAKDELNKTLKDDYSGCDNKLNQLIKGIEMVFGEFSKVFKSERIEVMDSLGKDYDPMHHEVLTVMDCDEKSDGKVLKEVQKGFICGDAVLRPAKVCIGKKKDKKEGGESKDGKKGNKQQNPGEK